MTDAVTVRAGTILDVARLVEIENAAFTTDRISPRSFRRQLRSPTLAILVAERRGSVHGYALTAFRRTARHARLYSLAVDVNEGRGLGRRLMAAAESAALARGYEAMRLEVNAQNTRAIGIYELGGYAQIGRHEDYYEDGSTALLYEKRLNDA